MGNPIQLSYSNHSLSLSLVQNFRKIDDTLEVLEVVGNWYPRTLVLNFIPVWIKWSKVCVMKTLLIRKIR